MYKIKTNRNAWLTVKLPDPEGTFAVQLQIKMIDHFANAASRYDSIQEQVARLRDEATEGETAADLANKFAALAESLTPEAVEKQLQTLTARIVDWKDIGDEQGNPLECTTANVRSFLSMGSWVVKTVRDAVQDFDDNGRRKN